MATKKRKRGPRPLPPGVSKQFLISCKVSASELALCDELAARHGLGRSEVMRRALHAVAVQPELVSGGKASFRRKPPEMTAPQVIALAKKQGLEKDEP